MKSMETTRQAITWGRFSSDQQKDGDSKDRQQRLNRECAKRVNVQVIKEYFDESKSVKSEVTPLFRKVIADLPNGVGIVAENLDRINRAHPWKQKAYIYEIVKDGHFIITSQDGTEYNNETIDQVARLPRVTYKQTWRMLKTSSEQRESKRQKPMRLSWQGKVNPLR